MAQGAPMDEAPISHVAMAYIIKKLHGSDAFTLIQLQVTNNEAAGNSGAAEAWRDIGFRVASRTNFGDMIIAKSANL